MLGQTVFYTLADADRIHSGALREPACPAVVTENFGDGTVTVHIFTPNPARPVLVRRVPAGDPGQPGTWNAALPVEAGGPVTTRLFAPPGRRT